jgi:hypothetical protein
MIYIVGTGVNNLKSNFVYALPKSKMSKKQFREHAETAQVINLASGNLYTCETDVVQDEQLYSSLNSALAFADQEITEVRINKNLARYIAGEINDANVRDIFFTSTQVSQKVNEVIAEVQKPYQEVVSELKAEINKVAENLNLMQSNVSKLEAAAAEEVQKLRDMIPSTSYKSIKQEWDESDFLQITKLNQALEAVASVA